MRCPREPTLGKAGPSKQQRRGVHGCGRVLQHGTSGGGRGAARGADAGKGVSGGGLSQGRGAARAAPGHTHTSWVMILRRTRRRIFPLRVLGRPYSIMGRGGRGEASSSCHHAHSCCTQWDTSCMCGFPFRPAHGGGACSREGHAPGSAQCGLGRQRRQ